MSHDRSRLISIARMLLRLGFAYVIVTTAAKIVMLAPVVWGDHQVLGLPTLIVGPATALAPDQQLTLGRLALAYNLAGGVLWMLALRSLLDMVNSARIGDPFVQANAIRLRKIGWIMLAGQLLRMLFGWAGLAVTGPGRQFDYLLHYAPSFPGLITILLIFVLAHVFETGTRMRTEIQETI